MILKHTGNTRNNPEAHYLESKHRTQARLRKVPSVTQGASLRWSSRVRSHHTHASTGSSAESQGLCATERTCGQGHAKDALTGTTQCVPFHLAPRPR